MNELDYMIIRKRALSAVNITTDPFSIQHFTSITTLTTISGDNLHYHRLH